MPPRLALGVCFLIALQLAAQSPLKTDDDPDDDEQNAASITVDVRVSPLGNVTFFAFGSSPRILDAIPKSLHCAWVLQTRNNDSLAGTCRGWLTSSAEASTATLHLAPLVADLRSAGAASVEVRLSSERKDLIVPAGWKTRSEKRRSSRFLSFSSMGEGSLPPDVSVPLTGRPNLALPVAVVLSVPVLLAMLVRRRANAPAEKKMNWIVWMNWINLGIWLYWISIVNPVEQADYLVLALPAGTIVTVSLGVLFYCVPPLLSMGLCLIAMAPLLSSSGESFKLLLSRQLVGQASVQIPLGIFLVGMGAADWSIPTLSIVAAYLVYRGLAWLNWSISYAEIVPLESGELFDRAAALAHKAGVKIARLGMLHTHMPEEANAFATSGDKIILTESLVRGLTPREVNAVIAHELGHHKAGHLRMDFSKILLWVYILAAGPAMVWLAARLHLPSWFLALPIAPLTFVVAQGLFSQRRELTADARAAQITGDPEGKIAALGRLARLSRVPVEDRGIMGSIMSHPSMEKRVLALARRHNIPNQRALAILRNPDEAYEAGQKRSATPLQEDTRRPPSLSGSSSEDSLVNLARAVNPAAAPPAPIQQPVFNLRARALLLEQHRWWHLLGPLLGAVLLGLALEKSLNNPSLFVTKWTVRYALITGPFLILAVELAGYVLIGKRFITQLRHKLTARLTPQPGAVFVGLHPGSGVRFTEGFPDWDFGFITLEGDWLCYRGEKTRFAIARQTVTATSVVKEPIAWVREHRVEVAFYSGVFTVNADFDRSTQATAARTETWIAEWLAEATTHLPQTAPPEPPPLLPSLPGMRSHRLVYCWLVAKTTFKIWLVLPVLIYAGVSSGLALAFPAFAAPLAVLLRSLPRILWPIGQMVDRTPQPQPAPAPEVVLK